MVTASGNTPRWKFLHSQLLAFFKQAITALAIWASIDDQARFVLSRDVGAYFGLTPRLYASGEMNRSGRITTRGDGTVRTLLYECANVLLVKISRTSTLRSWGLAIAQRSVSKTAKVADAPKVGVLLHRLWRDDTESRWRPGPLPSEQRGSGLHRFVLAGTTATGECPRTAVGTTAPDLAHHLAPLASVNANLGQPRAPIP